MARSKARSKPPSRRAQVQPEAPASADDAQIAAATEITARLQQIGQPGVRHGGYPGGDVGAGRPDRVEIRGARLTDHNLVGTSAVTASVELIAIQAYCPPDRPDCVAIRIDGWEGHQLLVLPRGRAELLATKLNEAIAASTATAGRPGPASAGEAPAVPHLVIDRTRPSDAVRSHRVRHARSRRPSRAELDVTDQVIDALAELDPEST